MLHTVNDITCRKMWHKISNITFGVEKKIYPTILNVNGKHVLFIGIRIVWNKKIICFYFDGYKTFCAIWHVTVMYCTL